MNSIEIALITFLFLLGSAVAGALLQSRLPSHHLSDQSKSAVHLGAGMIATLAALILGLLVSSTKGSYDQVQNLVDEMCASYSHADRLLANYGPEAVPCRNLVLESLEISHSLVWPEELQQEKTCRTGKRVQLRTVLEEVYDLVAQLKPSGTKQQQLQTDTLREINDIMQKRWLVMVIVNGRGISWILLVIPVLFISFITFVYALYAPRNPTVLGSLLCSSLCIAIALFLISELASPLQGILKISSRPVHVALDQMGAK